MAQRTHSKRRRGVARGPREPDLRRALERAVGLMALPGKSGQEGAVADYLRKSLREAGVPAPWIVTDAAHRRTLSRGDTGNLILKLAGTERSPRRLFTAHMDTVPICVGCRPVRRNGQVCSADRGTGLGADDRAGCAVLLTTAIEIFRHGLPHPPLTFCWLIQEEVGLQGARHVSKSLLEQPRMAFNWDGGSPAKLTVGATGGYRVSIDVTGRASHAGGAPEKGVSAVAIAALAIADLQRSGWHGDVHQEGKHGTSNFGYIAGGEATNVVMDRLEVRAEARSHDAEFRQRIVEEIELAFQRAAHEVRNVDGQPGHVRFDGRLDYEAFLLDANEPCVLLAERAVRSIGREPKRAVTNGGLDANWLTRHGIPTVSLGCGQKHPHTTDEALDVADFEDACRLALQLATDLEPLSG